MNRRTMAFMLLTIFLECGCSLYRERMYEFPLNGTDRTLVAYRIPTGPLERRFELRLESTRSSVLLHSYEGDWFHVTCAAVVVSKDRATASYLLTIWAPKVFVGAYDLANERPLGDARVDRDALRNEISNLYRGLPQFPKSGSTDLLEWAKDVNSCQEAFHARFGLDGEGGGMTQPVRK